MKELSIEEKAKAYDEALKVLHKYDGAPIMFTQDLKEEMFPELKESEDEKTKRLLHTIANKMSQHLRDIFTEEEFQCFDAWSNAWLEKQVSQDDVEDVDILHRFSFYSYKDEPNILYLSGFYVNEEYRNKGIGTKILEVADEVAKSLDCNSIRLKTKKDSDAERLYRTHGYYSLEIEDGDEIWLEKQGDKEENLKERNICDTCEDSNKCLIPCCAKLLENQDEQKPADKVAPKFKIGQTIAYKGTELITPTKMTISDIVKGQYWDDNCCIVPITDQDNWELVEQKSNNKDESKFKIEEGKWYVCTQTFVLRGKIVTIKGQTYQAEKDNAIKGEDECLFIDRHDGKASDYFKSWTVRDAKDGDVLITRKTQPFIFKSYDEDTDYVYAYCGISDLVKHDSFYIDNEDELWTCCGYDDDVFPATKEQREQLEKAMTDAGYTFDFKEKELKKIEQKPADIPEDFERLVEHLLSLSDGEGHGSPAKVKEVSSELLRLANQQNPAWSVEDDIMKHHCHQMLALLRPNSSELIKDIIDNCHHWLKTIKSKVQPKIEWSERDELMLEASIGFIKSSPYPYSGDTFRGEISKIEAENWLETLKYRVQPQPKEEWSEEDENRFKNLIELIEQSNEGIGTKAGFVEFINRLKSLKPQPKQKWSEEEALSAL